MQQKDRSVETSALRAENNNLKAQIAALKEVIRLLKSFSVSEKEVIRLLTSIGKPENLEFKSVEDNEGNI